MFSASQGFLYRALGSTLATGLEADKVEVLLLELLYKTDYGNDFDREVRASRCPLLSAGALRTSRNTACACLPACVHVGVHMCACACVRVHACMCVLVCACVPMHVGALLLCPLTPAGWVSPQGVILCFGLCARGQVNTVLNVLHDFEERIQESEQSWQIGAWQVRQPCSTTGSPGLS